MKQKMGRWAFVLALLWVHVSCDDVPMGVGPQIPLAPVVPAVLGPAATKLTSNSAILTANVRPNQLSTVCHFEYGTSLGYGQRSKDIFLGPDTGSVDVKDTVHNLYPGTDYHFRVVASNIGGSFTGPDAAFSTLAVVLGVSAINLKTNSAILTGQIWPNQLPTNCHFEYGTSLSYGQRMNDHYLGQDTGAVEVRDTLHNLDPGTVYHVRVVASNAGGSFTSQDAAFETLVEFVFPLTVGNSWQYTYEFHWAIEPSLGAYEETTGWQEWRVVSLGGVLPPFDATISLLRRDTTHHWIHNGGFSFDTTYATETSTNFNITVTSDSIMVGWPNRVWADRASIVFRIPRGVASGVDAVTLDAYGSLHTRYAQGVGLVSWFGFLSAIHSQSERLTLLSYSIK